MNDRTLGLGNRPEALGSAHTWGKDEVKSSSTQFDFRQYGGIVVLWSMILKIGIMALKALMARLRAGHRLLDYLRGRRWLGPTSL